MSTVKCMTAALLVTGALQAHGQSALSTGYAGEQKREVKSLSVREMADLRAGKGMGYAKPGELNGYPGPMHVLELADALALTAEQRAASQALIPPMRAAAQSAGERYIEAERTLDALFRTHSADVSGLQTALAHSAAALADVRASHLRAHLAQRALLTPQQIARYNELRGYTEIERTPEMRSR
jgi:Spy/CpxP family protein refolding chaperone